MKRLVIAINLCVLLSSCATHHGIIGSSSINRNVIYEDIAYGVAQSNMFLGIGGLSQDALVLEAKRELMKNRPLKTDEEYLNFTVDFKNSFWPFYSQTKVTVSADVIRFINDSNYEPYSENYKAKLSRLNLSNELFSVGDSILFDKTNKGSIISVIDTKTVRIEFKTKNDKVRTKKISIYNIYTTNKTYKEYRVGSRFIYSNKKSGGDETKTSGRIIALGLKSLIVKDNTNSILIIDYNN